MVWEFNYFLGLQVKQTKYGIIVSSITYSRKLVERFDMETSKTARTRMSTTSKLSKDE